jgi:hypothetical protein
MPEQKTGARHRQRVAFILLFMVCVASATSYFLFARHRSLPQVPPTATPVPSAPVAPSARQPSEKIHPVHRSRTRRLLFCSISPDSHSGHIATVALNGPHKGDVRFYDELACVRADFRGGRGICLHLNLNAVTNPNEALIFDKEFRIQHVLQLDGVVSRTRVSPNGEWGAVTVFTAGDSYTSQMMSTKTILIDMRTGTFVMNLEEMVVRNKGVVFKQPDFNFWGVTFTQDSRFFYATLATGGKVYLIKAGVATKQADVVYENIECPALSLDDTRIAFKKRSPGRRASWHLAVLDLKTFQETVLPEPTPIDQQVQWYDNHHVMYALPEIVVGQPIVMYSWIIAADGSGPPEKLFSRASSPVVYQETESD